MYLAERCAAAEIPFMLDPAPVCPLDPRLLKATTWLTPNETETFGLSGIDISSAQEPALRSVAEGFLAGGTQGVVLKLGARGAYLATRTVCAWIPSLNVDTVDTTAAGDAFNGAFAASLVRLGDPVAAARVACAAAALSTTRVGGISSMPSRAEVDRVLPA